MSTDMVQVLERLKVDLSFAGLFLDDPQKALKGYQVHSEEFAALSARSVQDLQKLGLSQDEANTVMSGAHSERCSS